MKQILGVLIKAAISVGLIALFLRQVDWRDIQAAAVGADARWLLLAVLMFGVSNCLGAVQWGALLRLQNITLPFKQVILLYFVGVFFNNFMIGNIGGDAVRIFDLKRLTGRGISGFAATFLDRFIGLFALSCFSVVAFLFTPNLWEPGLATPIAILGGGLLAVLCFGFSRRLSDLVVRLCQYLLPERPAASVVEIRACFLLYRHEYGALLRVGVVACGVQISRVGVYYCVGIGLGQFVGFLPFVVFIPMIAIVAAVPVSFGGIGVRENLGALLFGRVGVDPAVGLTMMFLGYLAGIAASLLGGVAFIARRISRVSDPQEISS